MKFSLSDAITMPAIFIPAPIHRQCPFLRHHNDGRRRGEGLRRPLKAISSVGKAGEMYITSHELPGDFDHLANFREGLYGWDRRNASAQGYCGVILRDVVPSAL